MHQEEFPDPDWGYYQPPDPPQQLEHVGAPIEVPQEWKGTGNGSPIEYKDYDYKGDWAWENYPMSPSYYEEEPAGWGTSSTERPLESSSPGIAAKVGGIITSFVILFVNPLKRFLRDSKRRKTTLLCFGLVILAISANKAMAFKVEEIDESEPMIEVHSMCEVKSIKEMFWEYIERF